MQVSRPTCTAHRSDTSLLSDSCLNLVRTCLVDPLLLTPMQRVNDVANMWGCEMGLPSSHPKACAVDATMDGTLAYPQTTNQLCDRVIADDAVRDIWQPNPTLTLTK